MTVNHVYLEVSLCVDVFECFSVISVRFYKITRELKKSSSKTLPPLGSESRY